MGGPMEMLVPHHQVRLETDENANLRRIPTAVLSSCVPLTGSALEGLGNESLQSSPGYGMLGQVISALEKGGQIDVMDIHWNATQLWRHILDEFSWGRSHKILSANPLLLGKRSPDRTGCYLVSIQRRSETKIPSALPCRSFATLACCKQRPKHLSDMCSSHKSSSRLHSGESTQPYSFLKRASKAQS